MAKPRRKTLTADQLLATTIKEVPLSDAGLLLTMDNIAGLGKLILNGGKLGHRQILSPTMVDEIFNPETEKGLATGLHTDDGEIDYHGCVWHLPYRSRSGKLWNIPSMFGYGGQVIQTLPNQTTVFRFGADSYQTEERGDPLKIFRLSDQIFPF